jgi:hypothetical protein
VQPFPSLVKIDESFDYAGLVGSTHHTWGMGEHLVFNGKFLSRHFGHNRIRALVGGKTEAFQIVKTKHNYNPFKYRFSYRVLRPGAPKWWEDKDILFTVNRDLFGRGFFGIKDEYRIYQGRERNGIERYYCVQSWWGWMTRCWHSKREYESGRTSLTVKGHGGPKFNPIAVLSQKVNAAAFSKFLKPLAFFPDKYTLFVNSGEDAALLTALSIIVDSTEDQKETKGGINTPSVWPLEQVLAGVELMAAPAGPAAAR